MFYKILGPDFGCWNCQSLKYSERTNIKSYWLLKSSFMSKWAAVFKCWNYAWSSWGVCTSQKLFNSINSLNCFVTVMDRGLRRQNNSLMTQKHCFPTEIILCFCWHDKLFCLAFNLGIELPSVIRSGINHKIKQLLNSKYSK